MSQEILLETGTNEFEILEFFITTKQCQQKLTQKSFFGINVAKVVEVIENPGLEITYDNVNPCFMGVIPLRGAILPVLDLSKWLKLDREKTKNEIIIVTEFSKQTAGFLVSGVVEIHRLDWTQVESPDKLVASYNDNCIVGIVQIEDKIIQLLDLEYMISDLTGIQMEPKTDIFVSETKFRAAIADDSKLIREMLRTSLREANFEVTEFTNGLDCWNHLNQMAIDIQHDSISKNTCYDIVITDIEMPQMDGFTLTKQIKKHAFLKNLPVLLYSSIITEELYHKGQSVGADEQMSKPDLHKVPHIAAELIKQKSRINN
ncbi:chemotaxis protein [Solidesulfovibrio magneticus]|uniref:Chemotaxis protein CheV n=1 Tax=Solidesulfovibrio magneticus (strain ATCC 700980 / DSM 13731 / RS-1) TaxID=573370 RepID=C4XL02_SOLM1|nr:chemotaxis protein [Solidesulfovibrio magneticus]BAH74541.1 chemotaxis protein CheV [Solidesulfovibrio magneticus RS-1]